MAILLSFYSCTEFNIIPPLNVMNRFTLEKRCYLFGQRETAWCRFYKRKNKIISDEAHLHLGGHVNKKNCRIWDSETLNMVLQKPIHPVLVTVWCVLWSGGISFKIEPAAITVNADTPIAVGSPIFLCLQTEYSWCYSRDTTPFTWKLVRCSKVLWSQPQQPYEFNNIPFLTGTQQKLLHF